MVKKTIGLVLGLTVSITLIVASYGLLSKLFPNQFHLPSADYRIGYRLVPEKVSSSAAVALALPLGVSLEGQDPAQKITFTPAISGHWIQNPTQKIDQSLYFQPDKALELNRHYNVALAIAPGQSLQEDFLAVPDPEVISILPTGDDEVLTNTKISVIFNRPMVPLSTLDQLSNDNLPITITPETPGRYKWISTNTLQFIPTDGLISSTEYKVSVNSGFRSLEGLPVKPKQSTFSTYKLRYAINNSAPYQNNMTLGYNQPFLIHFNQPVDLDQTAKQISVSNAGKSVNFVAKYWQAKDSEPVAKNNNSNLFAAIVNTVPKLNFANVISTTDKNQEDQTTIAIYPASDSWQLEQTYDVIISKAYPKSGGSITLNESKTSNFRVDDIIAQMQATSPRTNSPRADLFDPQGQLALTFYEDIDLGKSQISGRELDTVVYAKKCLSGYGDSCVKVDDKKKILVSFNQSLLPSGKDFQLNLDSIISSGGTKINPETKVINLKVYGPLVITTAKVASKTSLNSILICSNNPLTPTKDAGAIVSTPNFIIRSWNASYPTYSYEGQTDRNNCSPGEFETIVLGDLLNNSDYQMTVTASDVFGQPGTKSLSFKTQAVSSGDYSLQSYQNRSVVTTPSKTKLTYSAKFLPTVNVKVCKLSPYNFYQAKSNREGGTNGLCQSEISKTIPLPTGEPGRVLFNVDIKDYFPEATGNYVVTVDNPALPNDQWRFPVKTFVSVTNLTATEKRISPLTTSNYDSLVLTGDQLSKLNNLYWVIDSTTQAPIAGVTIGIYSKGALVKTATTDEQGIAKVTPVAGAEIAVASLGDDQVLISDNESELGWAGSAANVKKLYLYTAKPLYRPGQDVDIKGIYRLGYDGNYEVPAGQTLKLKVFDSADKVIKESDLTPNGFGSINTTITLDSSAPLGSYRACVDYNCASFDVLNYVPAAFQVSLDTKSDEFTLASQPAIGVSADYYFGVPVANATLNYRLTSQYYNFDKYTQEYFNFNNLSKGDYGSGYYYGDRFLGSGQTTLDDNGKGTIKPAIKQTDLPDPNVSQIIIVDTTTKNDQGRSIGAQKSFVLHAAPNYLGSKIDEPFVGKSQDIKVKIKTVKTDGSPIGLGGLKADIYKVSWTAETLPGDYQSWKRERKLVKTINADTDSNGDGTVTFSTGEEGEYEADLNSKSTGVVVGSRSWFYVYGEDHIAVRNYDDTTLELASNKDQLKPGETGEVLIKMPEGAGKALVTVERGKIFSYETINLTGTMTRFQFPIVESYYPNVYVSVVAYAPGKSVRFANKTFKIDSNHQKINLSVTTDKDLYSPGGDVSLRLKATDSSGQPVKAEISLAVVDLSVLALEGNPKKELTSFFYGNVPLTVKTYSNYRNLLKEIVPADGIGGEKGGSGGDPNKQKRRGVFKEVALWKPNIVTDDQGLAIVAFTLPDNLTTWQVEAIGVTTDTKVGAAYKEFTTNKPLMVSPLKPRFILPGDSFSLGATLFNHSASKFAGAISLAIADLGLKADQTIKNLSLDPEKSKTSYWDLEVPKTYPGNKISYTMDANGSGLSDIVDDQLPVNPNNTYEVTATAGQTSGSATELVYVPPTIVPDQGELAIRSSATLSIYLGDILEKILAYPYDCTEQIASQIRTLALLKKNQTVPDPSIDQTINKDLETIYNRQRYDGGFKLWSESYDSSIPATAEVVKAFTLLDQYGYKVDANVWDKAATLLFNQYLKPENRSLVNSPWFMIPMSEALFTRSEYRSNSALVNDFNNSVNQLLSDRKNASLNLLLAADQLMHRYNISSDLAARADKIINNSLAIDSRGAFLDASSMGGYDNTAISNTSRYISLLSFKKETNPELPNMLRWLVTSRDKDGTWGSTQSTLLAVTALTDYSNWQNDAASNFTIENSLNGKVVGQTETLPINQLLFGKTNTVTFAKSATTTNQKGNIYYDMSFKYYLDPASVPPRDEGFAIKRNLFALTDKKNEHPLNKAKVGDVLREHLEITVPVTRLNVAIEDFIPAGAEIVDSNLATEDQLLNIETEVKKSTLTPDHKEWRDDRAFLFVNELRPGTYQFDYLIRALAPGKYQQLPAKASEMYFPENFGRTGTNLFTIEQ